MLRCIGVLASLAVVAAMLAGTAQAQTTVTCVFTGLSGTLNAGTSAHGSHGHGIQNAQDDALDPATDVERGSYNFQTGPPAAATCGGTFNGIPVPATTAVITSSGFYDNIVCGTGFAHDLDGSGTSITAGAIVISPALGDHFGYEIKFKEGEGKLWIGPDGKPSKAGATELLPPDLDATYPGGVHGVHDQDGASPSSAGWGLMHGDVVSNWIGDGHVDIKPGPSSAVPPPAQDNCVNQVNETGVDNVAPGYNDTDQFRVTGYFTATKYQTGADGDL